MANVATDNFVNYPCRLPEHIFSVKIIWLLTFDRGKNYIRPFNWIFVFLLHIRWICIRSNVSIACRKFRDWSPLLLVKMLHEDSAEDQKNSRNMEKQ